MNLSHLWMLNLLWLIPLAAVMLIVLDCLLYL